MGKKVRIKEVVEKVTKLSEPVLIRFEHSDINPKVDIGQRLVANVYESVRGSSESHAVGQRNGGLKRKQVVIVHGDTDMTYIGSSDSQLNSDLGHLRTFIAVRDRKSKMRIYEVTPITVSPYLDSRAHLKHVEAAPKTVEERRAATIDLVKTFGSKKKRQVLERREKNQIESENMNESINTATQSVETVDEIPNIKDETVLQLVPPCNRETTNIQSVFQIHDILSEDDLINMDDVAKKWLNSTETQMNILRESKIFSDYFYVMWRKLSFTKADVRSIHLAKLVLYTELLICVFKLQVYELRRRRPNLPQQFPAWLVDKALSNFTTLNANNVRCRPETYKDKLCCHIFVLVLLANDFVLDIPLMSTSLQIHIKKLLKLARAVGTTVKLNSTTKEYQARLRLPLPKQIEGRGRARKVR